MTAAESGNHPDVVIKLIKRGETEMIVDASV